MSDKVAKKDNTAAPTEEVTAAAVEPAMDTPSKEVIAGWKEKFGILQMSVVGTKAYIYRQLSKSEHTQMLTDGLLTGADAEENVVQQLILFPVYKDIDFERAAGLASTLSQNMLILAGFGNAAEPVTL